MRIHAIQTGRVRVKEAQRARRAGGMISVLFSTEWSEWLPIYAWAIEHPEGIILVDTGETAHTSDPGYFPRWHPYFRMAAQMDVAPDEEIGAQLRSIGIDPRDVSTVVMTHLHTDHAGGLHHFPNADILVTEEQLDLADGFMGKLRGYLPHRWPQWFDPMPVRFADGPYRTFDESQILTEAGDVILVPTPGHTPGHLSVIVRDGSDTYFLAGDVSYTQTHLLKRLPDGVGPSTKTMLDTMDRVLQYAASVPLVYLPSHDPESAERLAGRQVLPLGDVTTAVASSAA